MSGKRTRRRNDNYVELGRVGGREKCVCMPWRVCVCVTWESNKTCGFALKNTYFLLEQYPSTVALHTHQHVTHKKKHTLKTYQFQFQAYNNTKYNQLQIQFPTPAHTHEPQPTADSRPLRYTLIMLTVRHKNSH